MKILSRNKTLYRQFAFASSLIILLPLIVIGTLSYYRSLKQLETQTEKMLEQILININSRLDKEIKDYTWIIKRILTSNEVYDFMENDPDDAYAKLEFSKWISSMVFKDFFLDRSYVDGMAIIADSGVNYIDYRLDYLYNESFYDHSSLADLKEKLPADGKMKMFITGLDGNNSGTAHNRSSFLITIGKRIISLKTLKPIGAFYLNLRSYALSEIWKKVDLQDGFLWIVNDENIVIHHPDRQITGKNAEDIIDLRIADGYTGKFKNSEYRREYFFVSDTSDYTGWKLIASIPVKQMRRPAENTKYIIFFTSLIAFPCTLGLGFLFFRSIVRPIKRLRQKMKEVGKGIFKRMEGRPAQNEIGELVGGFNSMVDKISELIDRVYVSELKRHKEELSRQKAEIQALQTQINPHFLYNTLATVNAYSEVNDRDAIQDIVKALGKMFRYAVLNPMELVEVKDEIAQVNNFLCIQKHRYKNLPEVIWDVDGYENYYILRLTLQPLFENVFKHAFPDGIEPGHMIIVSICNKNGNLILTVSDNGAGTSLDVDGIELLADERDGMGGIGLSNIHRRLKLAYGDKYGIRINGTKGKGTTVKIVVPLQRETADT